MNSNFKNIIGKFGLVILSNMASLMSSFIAILILPKIISVTEYGYWQLYMFYISFIGIAHLGWIDGIYLTVGGKTYLNLDKEEISRQLLLLTMFSATIMFLLMCFSLYIYEYQNRILLIYFSVNILIMNIRTLYVYIMQATNKLKESSYILIIDRVIFSLVLILFIVISVKKFEVLVLADIIGKITSLIFCFIKFKELGIKSIPNKESLIKSIGYIKIGINLMIANLASTLILGVIKLGLERSQGVETFSKVSLILSISNLVLVFVSAIGIVIFPILRRSKKEKLSFIYSELRFILSFLTISLMLGYYPLKMILQVWLPNYSDSLSFMYIVFPILVFDGKMALLINIYYKSLRYERKLLIINLVILSISLSVTIINYIFIKSFYVYIYSIICILAFRAIIAEIIVTKRLKINISKDLVEEILIVIAFIAINSISKEGVSFILFYSIYFMYFFSKLKHIKKILNFLRSKNE